jgi:hypothetical protein
MKRKILIVVLALGTIGGYAAGFRAMRRHCHWKHRGQEARIAHVCAEAARDAQ